MCSLAQEGEKKQPKLKSITMVLCGPILAIGSFGSLNGHYFLRENI